MHYFVPVQPSRLSLSPSSVVLELVLASHTLSMKLTSKLDILKIRSASNEEESANNLEVGNAKDTDDIDELDNQGQSILMGIISQLRLGADLSKISLPTFILEKKSMLERITNIFQIPQILLQADDTSDDVDRFLLMTKWYLASWHIAPKAVKKPLNPILGELYNCYWDDLSDGSSAYYVAEQVSHHPPKSAYFYIVPERQIRVDGTIVPKSKFLGNSSAAVMEGWGQVHLGSRDESYLMSQPNVYCRGILFGKLRYELGDNMVVKCPKLNLEATIEFKVKGLLSGVYDAIEGKVINTSNGDHLYSISGKWNDIMEIKNVKTGIKKVFFDTHSSNVIRPKVRPPSEQLGRESNKLWGPTIDALSVRDHELATAEKAKVESEQRHVAKKRTEKGEEYLPRLFKKNIAPELVEGPEYVLYKDFDFSLDPKTIEHLLFKMMPFLPGQPFEDDFDTLASEKS